MKGLLLLLLFLLPVGLGIWSAIREKTSRPTPRKDHEYLDDYYIADPEKFWRDMLK